MCYTLRVVNCTQYMFFFSLFILRFFSCVNTKPIIFSILRIFTTIGETIDYRIINDDVKRTFRSLSLTRFLVTLSPHVKDYYGGKNPFFLLLVSKWAGIINRFPAPDGMITVPAHRSVSHAFRVGIPMDSLAPLGARGNTVSSGATLTREENAGFMSRRLCCPGSENNCCFFVTSR